MSPNCECGHERGDHGPKMWGCAHCPCTEYEARTPAPDPTPSASPEADGPICRMLSGGVEWVPISELARVQWLADERQRQLDAEARVIETWRQENATLRAQLTEVQRERDEALADAATWRAYAKRADAHTDAVQCRCDNQRQRIGDLTRERDEWERHYHAAERHNGSLRATVETHGDTIRTLRARLAKAEQKLDTALERALVAEQNLAGVRERIETGVVMWMGGASSLWRREPSKSESQLFGPFTRGRFVADTEET